jgi:hypothetical protein
MESIATILPRSMNGAMKKSRTTLRELIAELRHLESYDNEDLVLPAGSLHMIDADHIATPNGDEYRLNDWSRRQLARLLGVRWERWFENADGAAVADDINRRLARATGEVRLRSRHNPEDAPEIRAIVTPGFTAVADSEIATGVQVALGHLGGEIPVLRLDITERSTTFVVGVGQPYRPGGDGRVGDVWGGVLVRNSGTGFAALACHMFLVRLACLNGMVVPHGDPAVLRRVHRGLDAQVLEDKLYARLRHLPARLRTGADALASSAHIGIDDVDAELRDLLEKARLPQRHLRALRAAYDREPHTSIFGISQAATLASQDMNPEDRFDLERAAGAYVRDRSQLAG